MYHNNDKQYARLVVPSEDALVTARLNIHFILRQSINTVHRIAKGDFDFAT